MTESAHDIPDDRDYVAEQEACQRLAEGDLSPFVERAKLDPGFVHELETIAAVNALKDRSEPDYARLIGRLKKEAKVRIAPFEAALFKARGNGLDPDHDGLPGKPLAFEEIELWPEPVDGAALLTELSDAIVAYVVMDKHQRDGVALWTVFAHAHNLRDYAPLLIARSAIKRSGKSRLAEIVQRLVPRPLYIAGLTAAFIERAIEDSGCTLIIDEADRIRKGDQALAERIDAQLNRSFKKSGAQVGKNVPIPGGGYEPRLFSTWAPTFVAGIGRQADTAEDRAVIIVLKRKLSSEKVKQLRDKDGQDLVVLARRIARFVADNETELRTHVPAALEVDNDRAKDVWEPLLVIAETAGGEWPERARAAGKALAGAVMEEEEEFNIQLLGDIRDMFADAYPFGYPPHAGRPDDGPRLASAEIVKRLLAIEDRPYFVMGKMQKPLTQHGLGRALREFDIRPRTVRVAGKATPRGYFLSAFEDAFSRYLPKPPDPDRNNATNPTNPEENEDSEPQLTDDKLRSETPENASNSGLSCIVAVQNDDSGEEGENSAPFEAEL